MTPAKRTPIRGSLMVLLLALVIVVALSSFAIRHPTFLCAQVVTTGVLTILIVATLGALVGRHQAAWTGFALFGWLYLISSLGPGSWFTVRPLLLTTRFLDGIYPMLFSETDNSNDKILIENLSNKQYRDSVHIAYEWEIPERRIFFQWTGHCLAALLHGVAGSVVALVFAARSAGPGEGKPTRDLSA